MSITTNKLMLEIGSEAYNLLTSEERDAICNSVSSATLGGLKAFELLWKKFKPSYRMGRMYEADSERYEAYYKMYCHYVQQVKAGKNNKPSNYSNRPSTGVWRETLES